MGKNLEDLLDSEYARKVKMGEISFADVPSEYKEEVKKELKANGFTMEISASG